jgi:hypothetical protein
VKSPFSPESCKKPCQKAPLCHDWLHVPRLKRWCIYIKQRSAPSSTWPLFSSPIRRHRVLFRHHPSGPPHLAVPPFSPPCPLEFSAAVGLLESAIHRPADVVAPHHTDPPPSAPRMRRLPPRPPCLPRLLGLLRASASSPTSSAQSSLASGAPPPPRAVRLAVQPAGASSPLTAHQHRLSHSSIALSYCALPSPS